MRVYFTRPLLRVLEGTVDTLSVKGRLRASISPAIEEWLRELPKRVIFMFNDFTTPDESLDYASAPIVYMPDEFEFHFDLENLGRLAREFLVSALPLDVSNWETEYVPVTDLWLGGEDGLLTKDERAGLEKALREVWALPIRGKVFVVDETSLPDDARRAGARDAVRGAGGILHQQVSPACDYYVTNSPTAAEAARKAGAKQVINTLTFSVMLSNPAKS